ncbi:uncharacterized protein [Watersipora subatra]|uniref:uncharacterized protein n=1 Tax=Watersipora subatra TaxID=2589382 RepID=UPI00355AF291
MKGVKTTRAERIYLIALNACLWIELLLLGLTVGFDAWAAETEGTSSVSGDGQWIIGLWRACSVPMADYAGVLSFYPSQQYNCTTLGQYKKLAGVFIQRGLAFELEILSLVLIALAGAMILAAHIFFVCGYVPKAKCKTCGLGGLTAVLITSGVCQVIALVTIYFMMNKEMTLQLSYYLTLANLLPTWLTAIGTLTVTCRTS